MRPQDWLEAATADATARGLADVRSSLEALARATEVLRAADWNDDATGSRVAGSDSAHRDVAPSTET